LRERDLLLKLAMNIDHPKYNLLLSKLKEKGKVAIAFSGGVDSAFLLAAAKIAVGDNTVGITVDSLALPRYELEDAVNIANLVGVKHIILKSYEIEEEIADNPVNRCYFCKKVEYGDIKKEAAKLGIEHVLDGSNADDMKDYRPGMKARDEVHVSSPLLEAGITKDEIREFSKALGLPTWDKPAYACLYSRIPYGQKIKPEDLVKIEKGEKFFIDRGFRTIRVRCHNDLARIEVSPADIEKLLQEPLKSDIVSNLKFFGFNFITIDLQGYRLGSFNEAAKIGNIQKS
jgi:pyridinium-3,5-biscarboxylic acid mononucleotide sulfurtransferase